MPCYSTGQVADLLGVKTHRLEYLLRDRQVRPRKGPTGAFYWIPEDIRYAAKLLGVSRPSKEELMGSREIRQAWGDEQ